MGELGVNAGAGKILGRGEGIENIGVNEGGLISSPSGLAGLLPLDSIT